MKNETENTQIISDRSIVSDVGKSIIKKRAEKLSVVQEKVDDRVAHKYLQARVGEDEIYGLPYVNLEEILQNVKITSIPSRGDSVIGVINWRGRILSIIDLAKMFNIGSKREYSNSWVSVINIDNKYIGCLVDDVIGDSHYIEEDLDKSLSSTSQIESSFVFGVYKGQVAILNLAAIFQACVLIEEEGNSDG